MASLEVLIVSACFGHGDKFGAAVGRRVAAAVEDRDVPALTHGCEPRNSPRSSTGCATFMGLDWLSYVGLQPYETPLGPRVCRGYCVQCWRILTRRQPVSPSLTSTCHATVW